MTQSGLRPFSSWLLSVWRYWLSALLLPTKRILKAGLLVWLGVACRPGDKMEQEKVLRSALDFPASFNPADHYRNAGDYTLAVRHYDSLIVSGSLSEDQKQYMVINRELCRLLAIDTLTSVSDSIVISSAAVQGNVSGKLVEGILDIKNGRSGLKRLYEAGATLRAAEMEASYEFFVVLENLGWCHQEVHGETDSSYFYFKKALDMASVYPELAPNIPGLLVQLAEVAITNRDMVASLGYTEQGLRLKPRDRDLHELLILKATLLRRMEQFDSAKYYYQLADETIQLKGDMASLARLLRERALHEMIVNNDSLFRYQMRRLESLPAHFANSSTVSTDRLYGFYHFLRGNVRASVDAYERTLAHFSKQRLPDIVQTAEAYWVLAYHYRQLKEYEKAERNIFASIVYFSPYKNSQFSWDLVTSPDVAYRGFNFANYQQLAEIELHRYRDTGDLQGLTRSFEIYQMIDSLMFQQIRAVEEDALLMFLRIGRWVYAGGIEASYHLYRSKGDSVFLNQAHLFMERSKGLITYQDLLARNQDYFSDVPEEFRTRELQLKARIAAMKRTYSYDSREMIELLREADDYYSQMQEKYPMYYDAKYQVNSESYGHYAAMADARQATFVQYFEANDYVYTVSYGGEGKFDRVEKDAPYSEALELMGEQLSAAPNRKNAEARQRFMEASALLFEKLIKPLGEVQNSLLIIPDGALSYLPFEVLVNGTAESYRDAPYLIRTCDINYSPSLQIYALNKSKENRQTKEIVAYSFTKSLGVLHALPGTRREAAILGKVFSGGNVTLRSNEEVTKEKLMEDLVSMGDIVHIGLHASSSVTNKLENKIACFSSAGTEEDAVYGYEIAPLTIRAHTVVLTACQSAFGPVVVGEGTYSLARAFKQAGVGNVVASLWNLSDGTTATLVESFYEGLKDERSAAESLSIAKRIYLKEADELTAHPHFWSGLICQGK